MSRNLKIIVSFIVLFVGILIFASEYFKSKKIEVYDYMNELYYNEIVDVEPLEELDNGSTGTIINLEIGEELVEDTKSKEINNYTYIGYLSIPKINFKKGFTEKDSKYNTVNKNIQILSSSSYPDEEFGNVIIAGHSGNSSVSYFKDLYKLNLDDYIYIDYNNVLYTYKIVDIYTIPKTGKAEIKRNKNKTTLTLITCTKNVKTTQTIYISELVNKE